MKTKILVAILLVLSNILFAAPPEQQGKTIFTARCASCHAVNKQLTGPALAGIDERRSIDWIINFVHSSQNMVKAGDLQAVALFEKFNKIPMPDHQDLTAADIKSIVACIKSDASAGEDKAPFAKPARLRPAYTPLTYANAQFFVSYILVIAMLVLALLFAVQIKQYERNLRDQE